jgi:dihydropteroate synthase
MAAAPGDLVFRGKRLDPGTFRIMAIINRTRDSFYDKGANFSEPAARKAIETALIDGADLIDVGGVRAGAEGEEVSAAEEARRVVPLIEWARAQWPELIISVDTWRHDVARAACEAGADLINDTWAGADPRLVHVAAEFAAGLVCSHTGGLPPRTDPDHPQYASVVDDVISTTTAAAEAAVALGVPRESILVDPTFDFGKGTHHSLQLLRHLDRLVDTGWPVLVALSRKDFIGETLGIEDPAERLAGTIAATSMAAAAGARMFRAHDVLATRHALETVATIQGLRAPTRAARGFQ